MNLISIIRAMLEWFALIALAVIVVPAMWVMAYLYPIWETWIKENSDFGKKWERVLLIVPLTLVVLVGMIIYRLLHGWFESKIKERWGLKLF